MLINLKERDNRKVTEGWISGIQSVNDREQGRRPYGDINLKGKANREMILPSVGTGGIL